MTFNALGQKVKGEDKTLAEKLGIKMPAPEKLEVVEVRADNLKEITIELSNAELVKDQKALVDARNYRTNAGEVLDARLDGNNVILTIKGKMAQGREYNLSIRDIDKAINGITKGFKVYDNAAPYVENVEVLGTQGIRVTMSEPIENPQERDFLLNGKNFVVRVETQRNNGRDITLIPYRENANFEEGKHTLTVGQLKDYAGFKSKAELFEIEIIKDETKPVVKNVIARNNSVIVEFENEVHPDSVARTNLSWIQLRGRKAVKADGFEILEGNKIEYKFNKSNELPKPAVDLVIQGLKNYSGIEMDKDESWTNVPIEVDFTRPEIVNYKMLDDNRMEIEFSKTLVLAKGEIAKYATYFSVFKDGSNVETRYAVKGAKYDGDKTITVEFDKNKLTKGQKYILHVELLRDNTTLQNTMLADELEFVYGIAEGLKVIGVSGDAKEIIVLEFNEDLIRAEAEDLRNYEFEAEDGIIYTANDLARNPRATLYGNGRFVEILLPNNGKTIKNVHLGLSLKSLDGNRAEAANRKVNLEDNFFVLESATLKDDKTLELVFNEDIKVTKEENGTIYGLTLVEAKYVYKAVKDNKLTLTITSGVPTEVKINKANNIKQDVKDGKSVKETGEDNFEITDKRDLLVTEAFVVTEADGTYLVIFTNKNAKAEAKDIEVYSKTDNKILYTLDKMAVDADGKHFHKKLVGDAIKAFEADKDVVVRYAGNDDVKVVQKGDVDALNAEKTTAITAINTNVGLDTTPAPKLTTEMNALVDEAKTKINAANSKPEVIGYQALYEAQIDELAQKQYDAKVAEVKALATEIKKTEATTGTEKVGEYIVGTEVALSATVKTPETDAKGQIAAMNTLDTAMATAKAAKIAAIEGLVAPTLDATTKNNGSITGYTAETDETLNVTSSDKDIVKVDSETGLSLTAVAKGTATVTVKVKDSTNVIKIGTVEVTVGE